MFCHQIILFEQIDFQNKAKYFPVISCTERVWWLIMTPNFKTEFFPKTSPAKRKFVLRTIFPSTNTISCLLLLSIMNTQGLDQSGQFTEMVWDEVLKTAIYILIEILNKTLFGLWKGRLLHLIKECIYNSTLRKQINTKMPISPLWLNNQCRMTWCFWSK